MSMEWENLEAHVWKAYMGEGRHRRTLTFTWFYEGMYSKMLAIDAHQHSFGPYCYEYAEEVLESLEDILEENGAAMASFLDTFEYDGSTRIWDGALKSGEDYPAHIQLHAYVEMWDKNCEPVRFTLAELQDFHDALYEVLSWIEIGYEGDEPWIFCKEAEE